MEKLTKEQGTLLSCFTGALLCNFSDFHEKAESLLGRPIFTHEFADRDLVDELKKAAKPFVLSMLPTEDPRS